MSIPAGSEVGRMPCHYPRACPSDIRKKSSTCEPTQRFSFSGSTRPCLDSQSNMFGSAMLVHSFAVAWCLWLQHIPPGIHVTINRADFRRIFWDLRTSWRQIQHDISHVVAAPKAVVAGQPGTGRLRLARIQRFSMASFATSYGFL